MKKFATIMTSIIGCNFIKYLISNFIKYLISKYLMRMTCISQSFLTNGS